MCPTLGLKYAQKKFHVLIRQSISQLLGQVYQDPLLEVEVQSPSLEWSGLLVETAGLEQNQYQGLENCGNHVTCHQKWDTL